VEVAVNRCAQGVQVSSHGAQLVDPLLFLLTELLVTLNIAGQSMLQLLAQPDDLGLRLIVRESELIELTPASFVFVQQRLEILGELLIEGQDLWIGSGRPFWLRRLALALAARHS
jgi:hypothetical protein